MTTQLAQQFCRLHSFRKRLKGLNQGFCQSNIISILAGCSSILKCNEDVNCIGAIHGHSGCCGIPVSHQLDRVFDFGNHPYLFIRCFQFFSGFNPGNHGFSAP
ncbi:hypothetical protein VB715_07430 [Crocosphaera sp. UHCC 0190]|uniref:hypothetical protein n=1 Tax=Crocosphaera sp. UHCC 0190 TaxID=3110246 RepID=UPI002B1F7696|nr:hypothetical protein [Crocosphaera sp. UHCC 0190]MEA5509591.1 hypothetical protein [Crocosphaera sp. UHCC 0190]